MRDYLAFEKKLKCPEGTIADWKAQGMYPRQPRRLLSSLRTTPGLLELKEGDFFLLRSTTHVDKNLTEDILKEDVLATMVTGE